MSASLVAGPVTVAVPATSANLGPGFDSLGLALELRDEVTAEISDSPGVEVTVRGEGEGVLPMGSRHLVAATVLRALADVGVTPAGLRLSAINRIPHGRGLGSSAAAIVAAVALARELTGGADSPISLDRAFDLSVAIEGHPDNVAPALLGGLTIAWPDASTGLSRAVTLAVHPSHRVRAGRSHVDQGRARAAPVNGHPCRRGDQCRAIGAAGARSHVGPESPARRDGRPAAPALPLSGDADHRCAPRPTARRPTRCDRVGIRPQRARAH